jgi:hypothetical protein
LPPSATSARNFCCDAQRRFAQRRANVPQHPPAATIAGRSIDDIREEVRKEFMGGGDREDYVEKRSWIKYGAFALFQEYACNLVA